MLVRDAFLTSTAFPPFLPGEDRFEKSGNLKYRTSHRVLDVSLKREPHIAAVY
jgi:hypothetical protein